MSLTSNRKGLWTRRSALLSLASIPFLAKNAAAFGNDGAFHPRPLLVGATKWEGDRITAPARWAWELIRRTSAPSRLVTEPTGAASTSLLLEPFCVWSGAGPVAPLSAAEVKGLQRFLKLGGVLFVDDSNPAMGTFGSSVRRELARVIANSPPVALPTSHVIYKSYYLIEKPVGRLQGPDHMEAIFDGKRVQVLLSSHDLLGALARTESGWTLPVDSNSEQQREMAIRMAVNIAMYVLCSDYKDDQVHAKALMRRRGDRSH